MKKTIISGSITTAKADVIGHIVNCNFVMGAGVAKSIRDKWPVVYTKYTKLREDDLQATAIHFMGTVQMVILPVVYNEDGTPHRQYVANLFAEENVYLPGVKVSYEALEDSLLELKKFAAEHPIDVKTLAFPYGMGAGLGGGDWATIESIIDKVFADTNLNIELWKLA